MEFVLQYIQVTSVSGPKSQEGACESLKDPITLAIDV